MDSELLAVTGPSGRRAYSPITTPFVYKGIVRSRAEQSIGRTQRTVESLAVAIQKSGPHTETDKGVRRRPIICARLRRSTRYDPRGGGGDSFRSVAVVGGHSSPNSKPGDEIERR